MTFTQTGVALFTISSILFFVSALRTIHQQRFSAARLRMLASITSVIGLIQTAYGTFDLMDFGNAKWRALAMLAGFQFLIASATYWFAARRRHRSG